MTQLQQQPGKFGYKSLSLRFELQCNELNGGHPTFFCQSQDKFRTKESEFVHFGPITNDGLAAKSCLYPSTKRQLNIYWKMPRIFKTKPDQTQIHLSNDGLTEDEIDSTQIWLIIFLSEQLDRRECCRLSSWRTYIVMQNVFAFSYLERNPSFVLGVLCIVARDYESLVLQCS